MWGGEAEAATAYWPGSAELPHGQWYPHLNHRSEANSPPLDHLLTSRPQQQEAKLQPI